MLIYNTTFHCEKSTYDEFVTWMRTQYIPVAVQHKGVSEPRMARIMTQDENEGISISVQFCTASLDSLSTWYETCGAKLVEQLEKKFQQRVAGFSTIMQQIDL
ncbi:MAG: DUF4286 family protein [Bacteroidaceae bacterium]|mgnify:CR=1 FL=1|nr:DUF4286 family protein [Bacteroidaceae bacterium]